MIVDDEYVLLGSANVNQRSLDGSRDTEIAVGAAQAGHLLPDDHDQDDADHGHHGDDGGSSKSGGLDGSGGSGGAAAGSGKAPPRPLPPLPRGEVSAFRRALFKEHVGVSGCARLLCCITLCLSIERVRASSSAISIFQTQAPPSTFQPPQPQQTNQPHKRQAVLPEADDPSTLECARRLRAAGDANWAAYAAPAGSAAAAVAPAGHLLTYPLAVTPDGSVGPLPGAAEFPDVGGSVVGARSLSIPAILTT